MIRSRLGANPIAIQLPIGQEADFRGIIDLLSMEAAVWEDDDLGAEAKIVEIPEDFKQQADEARQIIIERIVETDDALMEQYLEGEEPTVEQLRAALRNATVNNLVTPVLCGTALRNKGIQRVLDAVIHYLPSPLDVPPIQGMNPFTEKPKNVHLLMMSHCLRSYSRL